MATSHLRFMCMGFLALRLALSSPCPVVSNTSFVLADVLVEWAANTNIEHGVQFEDVNGDGLADMIYGWDDGSSSSTTCVYLNTGYSWVQQGTTAGDCAATTFLLVRDTFIPFKKHSVGQFRQVVAAEFGLRTEDVVVLGRNGLKYAQTTPLGDLFPRGFEVHIAEATGKRLGVTVPEVYTCP